MIEPQTMEMAALIRRQSRAFRCVESLFCRILPLLALLWTGQLRSAPFLVQRFGSTEWARMAAGSSIPVQFRLCEIS